MSSTAQPKTLGSDSTVELPPAQLGQPSPEAVDAMHRAAEHARGLAAELAGGIEALRAAGLDDFARRAEKVAELLRLPCTQLSLLARRVGGG